jgi:AcrR family transcriptional regulator
MTRRQQLIDAAAGVFARKGYRAASISDVIARAGVARGTFYLYFDSKEQVFLAIVDDFCGRAKRMLDAPETTVRLDEHHGQAMLKRLFRRWLELFAAHRDAAAVVLREAPAIDPRFEASLTRLRNLALSHLAGRVRRVQAAGLVNGSPSPELVARLQMAMVEESVRAFVLPEPSVTVEDLDNLAGQLAAFEWNGIRPDSKLGRA